VRLPRDFRAADAHVDDGEHAYGDLDETFREDLELTTLRVEPERRGVQREAKVRKRGERVRVVPRLTQDVAAHSAGLVRVDAQSRYA